MTRYNKIKTERKEQINLSFCNDMIVYVENPKKLTKKPQLLPELINDYKKIAGYKINIQMPIVFLYNSDEQEEFEIENKTSVTLAPLKNEIFMYKSNKKCTKSI